MKRYFEITVVEGGHRITHYWDDFLLSHVRAPLGELLESELKRLRQEVGRAAKAATASQPTQLELPFE